MLILILGLILWWATHVFKRLAPGPRASLQDRFGDASKGIIAALVLLSVILMVIGYRGAEFNWVYDPPSWGLHLNNLLMIIAIALFGLGNSKSRFRGALRHPMLTGLLLWAIAHLLANGDLASVVLFGGLGVWAIFAMLLINRAEPEWTRPEPGTVAGDIKLGVITLVLTGIIAAIHTWLGYWPFPG